MALRDKFRRLEKRMQGQLGYFELRSGQRYYFDSEEAFKITFGFFGDSLTADYRREPRPEPPDLLKAVADAKDRGGALYRVMGDFSHLPIERETLLERGEFVPRSLVAGRTYNELLEERARGTAN